ncbi:glycosyltransferase family 2 protein [Clostridium perfringens]|uniref:glycosyltransferase n=1 Tax=Clostridium perfringens TaxID=1502 RepID=UPI001CCF86AA|nr:glycosyltransferase family 2 protein [Clostridium perfringens]UBK83912.1 glycosyltransferase family 2 protein [Clostridium perfringens]
MSLAVIILNFNTYEKTIECVESILNTYDNDLSIYIIDNCSKNNSYNILKNKFSSFDNIFIIKSLENGGYAKGNNIGIKKAIYDKNDYLLICNNDVIFKHNSIKNMLSLIKNKHIHAVGPKILNEKNEFQEDSFKNKLGFKEKIFVTTPLRILNFKKIKDNYYYKNLDRNNILKVYCLSGSCMLFKSYVLEDIGLFDEKTFLYEEEPILFSKFNNKGYNAFYQPNSEVIHLHGFTTKSNRANSFLAFLKSEKYYCKEYLEIGTLKYSIIVILRSLQYICRCTSDKSFRKSLREFINVIFK